PPDPGLSVPADGAGRPNTPIIGRQGKHRPSLGEDGDTTSRSRGLRSHSMSPPGNAPISVSPAPHPRAMDPAGRPHPRDDAQGVHLGYPPTVATSRHIWRNIAFLLVLLLGRPLEDDDVLPG